MDHTFDEALWVPSEQQRSSTQMWAFMNAHGVDNYSDLHRWSVEQPEQFWSSLWRSTGLGEPSTPAVLDGPSIAETRFFPNARLNVAEVILNGRGAKPHHAMLVSTDECGRRRSFDRSQVRAQVAQVAQALRSWGVVPGDRVAAWMPNVAETAVFMLAAASVGAVFSSTSPDFGVDGVLDRFGQIGPKVLLASDGYYYGGKTLDCVDRLATIASRLPTVERVIVVNNLDWNSVEPKGAWRAIPGAWSWAEVLAEFTATEVEFESLPFDHPWYVLYSSGTTGVPKCIVHRTGGVLLQHLKEHQLHCDIRPGDRVSYYTTCGWMMWNWLVSVPASGATAVLYDGSPFHPGPGTLSDLAEAEALSFLGVSAKYLDSLKKDGFVPAEHCGLASLRTIASTGSPLSPETCAWTYQGFKSDLHVASISGGTDLCGCFVCGDPTSPVYAGEIQRPALGLAVQIFDEHGTAVGPGIRGELVCTQAFPSMPLGFWDDPDGAKYRGAYYEKHDGVWAHGDFASWTDHGGMVIHGRSDTTLNPGGVRIGTAEIYRRVEQIPEVVESLVFGRNVDDDVKVVLLVRLAEGVGLSDDLIATIKHTIRVGCTPRHVPAQVLAVDDLPRTRSGKLAELAVTDAVNGREVRNTTALANPEAIDAIVALFAV